MEREKIKGCMLVMCSDSRHSNCTAIANKIQGLSSEIKETQRIRYNLKGSVYCIATKVEVPPDRLDTLKQEINSVYDEESKIGVSDVKAYKDRTIIENYIDGYETKKRLWRTIFGNENAPEWEADAVTKYAGSLRKVIPNITRKQIDEAIREAKEK